MSRNVDQWNIDERTDCGYGDDSRGCTECNEGRAHTAGSQSNIHMFDGCMPAIWLYGDEWCHGDISNCKNSYYQGSDNQGGHAHFLRFLSKYQGQNDKMWLHGYNVNNRLDCCAGIKNDDVSCAGCWCPKSTKPVCDTVMKEHCTRIENGKSVLFTDPKCLNYKIAAPDKYKKLVLDLCNVSSPDKMEFAMKHDECRTFCNTSIGTLDSCHTNIKKYCDTLTHSQKLAVPTICACYMEPKFYENIKNGLSQLGGATNLTATIPKCIYPPCMDSGLQTDNAKNENCPSLNACINNLQFTNNGTINTSSLTLKPNNECKFSAPENHNNTNTNTNVESKVETSTTTATSTTNTTPSATSSPDGIIRMIGGVLLLLLIIIIIVKLMMPSAPNK